MAAIQFVDVPGYAAGIFRLTKQDMTKPDAILSRAHEWFRGNPNVHWDASENSFYFRTGAAPATLHFGYVAISKDLQRYQGSAFQFCGIDEAGQWNEYNYRYLFSRLRKPKSMAVPIRMRLTANPGGRGHEWVKERFVDRATHVDTGTSVRADILANRDEGRPLPAPRVYQSPPTEEELEASKETKAKTHATIFVPSFAEDNPGLDVEEYKASLSRLDIVTRQQLKDGNWDAVFSGNYFKAEWFAGKILDTAPTGIQWVRSWDTAATEENGKNNPDWTVGVKLGIETLVSKERRVIVADVKRFRKGPGETEREMKLTSELDGVEVPIVLEQEPGSAGKIMVHGNKTRVFFGHTVHSSRRTGNKASYWTQLATQAEAGNVFLVRGDWNTEFIRELCALPVGHDDQADAAAFGFSWLATHNRDEKLQDDATKPSALSKMRAIGM